MNEFEKAILKIIADFPGISANNIAQKLNCNRQDVNTALYGNLKSLCYQDSSYRWSLRTEKSKKPVDSFGKKTDKLLENICKYYLNCLSLENSNGISAYLISKSALNYVELSSLSVDISNENIDKLVRRVSTDRSLTAYVGYPSLIEKFHSIKNNQDYFKIAPIFLFPTEVHNGAIDVDFSTPRINREVIKQYSPHDINTQIYDLIELENELGLNSADVEIRIDELVARLQSIRDWNWKEPLNPLDIKIFPPARTITQEGYL